VLLTGYGIDRHIRSTPGTCGAEQAVLPVPRLAGLSVACIADVSQCGPQAQCIGFHPRTSKNLSAYIRVRIRGPFEGTCGAGWKAGCAIETPALSLGGPAHFAPSHSSRSMPARARISFSNGMPMSSEWGLGMVSLRVPFVMKWCLPPL
jgi:hypothetical protein